MNGVITQTAIEAHSEGEINLHKQHLFVWNKTH